MYMTLNCTTFSFSREMDHTKASIFYVTSFDYETPVHVTGTRRGRTSTYTRHSVLNRTENVVCMHWMVQGGCTLTSERRSLRARTTPGLELTHRQTKKGHTQTLNEVSTLWPILHAG